MFNEKILISTLLAVVFLLHIFAGTLLRRAEAEGAVFEHDLVSRLYD